jgi:FkbM family methyltransferase
LELPVHGAKKKDPMKFSQLINQVDSRSDLEKWCRAQTQQAYLGNNTALCRVLGNLLMYVDTRDLSIAPHMLMNGFWEMWVTQAVCSYVKPGMRCIDVGANVGYYTLLLSEIVGERGEVRAYEPQRIPHDLLCESVGVNGFSWVSVRRFAASDVVNMETRVMMYVNPAMSGSGSLLPWAPHERLRDSMAQETVYTSRLDMDCLDPVDFVKIDVQGHEMQVLEGMRGIIERSSRLAIAMEFSPKEHADATASLERILELGLTLKTIGTDGIPRPISIGEAKNPETGDHRMLWLSKG